MVFIGFDIGTTHIKYLVLCNDGKILDVYKENTLFVNREGIIYFDLLYIEKFIFDSIDHICRDYLVKSISISSVGESVVPVKRGKAAAFPLFWDSKCTQSIVDELSEDVNKYALYKNVGTIGDYTFSIYKIYWMKKYLNLENIDYWLPLSSYLNYLLTGKTIWCESHACRSLLYDIYQGAWIEPLLESIGITKSKLGDIQYTGSAIGKTKNNILVTLSGHDHITGLFGIHKINQNRSFVYQSMGTSSVIATISRASEKIKNIPFLERPFSKNQKGKVSKAFAEKQFFLQNSFRYFGKLFETLSAFCGYNMVSEISLEPSSEVFPQDVAVFAVENDPIFALVKGRFPIIHMPDYLTKEDAIQSVYIYLAVASSFALEDLKEFLSQDFFYYIGGGFSKNYFLVNYLAAAIQKPLLRLHTEEVTALGAAFSAVYGFDATLVKNCIENIEIDILHPKKEYIEKMEIYKNVYQKWIDRQ